MKEIYAVENEDRTFQVTVKEKCRSSTRHGHAKVENATECEMTIPRAELQITAFRSLNPDGTLMTFCVSE